jgi:Domain of unknown function (DUF4347)
MPTLTWKDSRLPADDVAPYDTTVMFVGPTSPLAEMVSESVSWCKSHENQDLNLMIYCHGSPGYLQLCKEGVRYSNAGKLLPLKPYFSAVSIHACEVAKGNAGKAFCVKLAEVLAAWVEGAVQLQYNTGTQSLYGWLDDKKYDGDYYIHKPSGERTGPLRSR